MNHLLTKLLIFALGLEAVSQIFGENVNKEIMKLLARTSGQVLSGFKDFYII